MTEAPNPGQIICQSQEQYADNIIWPSVRTKNTLVAMSKVNRHDFAPEEEPAVCYSDYIIPLGDGSSLSQPTLVAQMIDHLDLDGRQRVLEIGTGSGYNAAILSHLAKWVDTIEYNSELATNAQSRLENLGYENVKVHIVDGAQGLPDKPQYDAIIVTAGVKEMPYQLVKQLAEGGRIIAPVGTEPSKTNLVVAFKRNEELVSKKLHGVTFHPLVSKFHGGWDSYEEYDNTHSKDEETVQFSMSRVLRGAARYLNMDLIDLFEGFEHGSTRESLKREAMYIEGLIKNQQNFDEIDDQWAEQSQQEVVFLKLTDKQESSLVLDQLQTNQQLRFPI